MLNFSRVIKEECYTAQRDFPLDPMIAAIESVRLHLPGHSIREYTEVKFLRCKIFMGFIRFRWMIREKYKVSGSKWRKTYKCCYRNIKRIDKDYMDLKLSYE